MWDTSPKVWVPALIVNILAALSTFGVPLPGFVDTPEEATAIGASLASILSIVIGYLVTDPARPPASVRGDA
jgi:uncharacterized membrane protein